MDSSRPLRQRSVSRCGSFGDSVVTAVDDGAEKEGSSAEAVEPSEMKRVLTEESICKWNIASYYLCLLISYLLLLIEVIFLHPNSYGVMICMNIFRRIYI